MMGRIGLRTRRAEGGGRGRPHGFDRARVRAIVFDLDGTLYSQPALRRAMTARLVRAALASPVEGLTTFRALQAYRRAQEGLRERPVETDLAAAQLDWACRRSGLARAVVARAVATWMEEAPLPILARLVEPALVAMLDEAQARGIALGVLSDYPPAAKLDALGFTTRFAVAIGAQDAGINRFKPDPRGLLEAFRRLGVDPADGVYVGDRPDVDAPTAAAAGVPCVIIGARARRASGWITACDFADLHALLFAPSGSAP